MGHSKKAFGSKMYLMAQAAEFMKHLRVTCILDQLSMEKRMERAVSTMQRKMKFTTENSRVASATGKESYIEETAQ
jgi:hypothetical protein